MFSTSQAISSYFYNVGSIFLTIYFKRFVFMELFDLNSNLNNLLETSSIKDFLVDFSVNFLVDFLMCLCISLIALQILKSSSSGSILINLQPSSFSNASYLCISWSVFLSLFLSFLNFYCKYIVMKIKINSIT